jgi:hypothetical protein
MSVATFDFTNLIIKPQNFLAMDAGPDIYSEWKRLLLTGPTSNAGAPPAFDVSVGGNDIGNGQTISPYFFMRNDLGWRIEGPVGSGELTINGNLFLSDVNTAGFQADSGGGTVLIRQVVSPQSITDAGQDQTLALLVKLLRNKLTTDPVTGDITLFDDDSTTVLLQAPLYEDIAETQLYRGRGAEVRDRMV